MKFVLAPPIPAAVPPLAAVAEVGEEEKEEQKQLKRLRELENQIHELEQENKKTQQRIEDFNFAEKSRTDFNVMKNIADNTSLVDNIHQNICPYLLYFHSHNLVLV